MYLIVKIYYRTVSSPYTAPLKYVLKVSRLMPQSSEIAPKKPPTFEPAGFSRGGQRVNLCDSKIASNATHSLLPNRNVYHWLWQHLRKDIEETLSSSDVQVVPCQSALGSENTKLYADIGTMHAILMLPGVHTYKRC